MKRVAVIQVQGKISISSPTIITLPGISHFVILGKRCQVLNVLK